MNEPVAPEAAGLSKSSSKPLAYHLLELRATAPAVGGLNKDAEDQPAFDNPHDPFASPDRMRA